MKLMRYTNEEGTTFEEVSVLYMNGYDFGDRLLEDVPFKITIEDGKLKAECQDKYDPGINWPYWEKKCAEVAQHIDCLSVSSLLTDDDGYVERD